MNKVMKRDVDDYGAFLSKSDAAMLSGSSVRSIDKWRERYGLKSVKIGNFVRIAKADLLEFMQSHQQVKTQKNAERQEGKSDE